MTETPEKRPSRTWCPASGSDDSFAYMPFMDEVRCAECFRFLHLTKHHTLPKHLSPTPADTVEKGSSS